MTSYSKLPTTFTLGIASVAILLLAMMLMTAQQESFTRDDFAFLAYAQRPHWSWREVYLPFQERWWWAYRPLGMQTYFYLCFQLFGLNAFGYFAVAIAGHFATGWLAYRLMLRLAFAPVVAATAALLTLTRFPTANDIFYGSVFHYTAAVFFALLATIFFIDSIRSGRHSKAAASLLCIVLGLLCNEFVIIYPILFLFVSVYCDSGGSRDTEGLTPKIATAFRRASPQLLVAALYWYFRFHLIADVATHAAYQQTFKLSWIHQNSGRLLYYFFGDLATLIGFFAVLVFSLFSIWKGRRAGVGLGRWWLRTSALCVVWIIGLLAPFAILVVSHARFAKPLEVPMCMLFAVALQLLWQTHASKHAGRLQAAMILLTLLSLPFQTLLERYREPLGAYPLALAEAIETHYPNIEVGSRVVLLYNAPGLASHAGGEKFKRFSFGGTAALQGYFQNRQLTMQIHNLWNRPVAPGCDRCIYLQLLPKLKIAPAERRFIDFHTPYPRKPLHEGQKRRGV